MSIQQQIEEIALNYPVCEYTFGDIEEVPFSDKIWYICKTDCKRYGKSWSCPPYAGAGDLEKNIEKCKNYQKFLVFSTVTEVENAWDAEVCLACQKDHTEVTDQMYEEIKALGVESFLLSTGCVICEECACPNEPCRHPEQRHESMESHGINVMQLSDAKGMCYNYGGDTVVYFSMVLFNE
ncbi:hypothetical protein P261_01877 [Lachnospiraceae bacterium TWA4]|nr:hypothetical protein P261_01877 [Lachnospiraceae bacterium TWA4]